MAVVKTEGVFTEKLYVCNYISKPECLSQSVTSILV